MANAEAVRKMHTEWMPKEMEGVWCVQYAVCVCVSADKHRVKCHCISILSLFFAQVSWNRTPA